MPSMDKKEIRTRAIYTIASQYRYKEKAEKNGSYKYAEHLLNTKPQLWAYQMVLDDIKSDGFRINTRIKDLVWNTLGGTGTVAQPKTIKAAIRNKLIKLQASDRPTPLNYIKDKKSHNAVMNLYKTFVSKDDLSHVSGFMADVDSVISKYAGNGKKFKKPVPDEDTED